MDNARDPQVYGAELRVKEMVWGGFPVWWVVGGHAWKFIEWAWHSF